MLSSWTSDPSWTVYSWECNQVCPLSTENNRVLGCGGPSTLLWAPASLLKCSSNFSFSTYFSGVPCCYYWGLSELWGHTSRWCSFGQCWQEDSYYVLGPFAEAIGLRNSFFVSFRCPDLLLFATGRSYWFCPLFCVIRHTFLGTSGRSWDRCLFESPSCWHSWCSGACWPFCSRYPGRPRGSSGDYWVVQHGRCWDCGCCCPSAFLEQGSFGSCFRVCPVDFCLPYLDPWRTLKWWIRSFSGTEQWSHRVLCSGLWSHGCWRCAESRHP